MGGGGCLPKSDGKKVHQKLTKSDQNEGGSLPETDGEEGWDQIGVCKRVMGEGSLPKKLVGGGDLFGDSESPLFINLFFLQKRAGV